MEIDNRETTQTNRNNWSIPPILTLVVGLVISIILALIIYLAINYINDRVFDTEIRSGIVNPTSIIGFETAAYRSSEASPNILIFSRDPNLSSTIYFKNLVSQINSNFKNFDLPPTKIYLLNNQDYSRLVNHVRSVELPSIVQFAGFISSGNYIYIPNEVLNKDTDIDAFTHLTLVHLFWVNLYNQQKEAGELSLLVQQGLKYSTQNTSTFKEYLALEGVTEQLPYPDRIQNYRLKSSYCLEINNYLELFNCELWLVTSQRGNLLATKQSDFFKKIINIDLWNMHTILGLTDSKNFENIFQQHGKTSSKVLYDNWAVKSFTANSLAGNQSILAYTGFNEDTLLAIKNSIVAAGWTFVGNADPIPDEQFDATQKALYFAKETELYTEYLSLLIMDTSELNADCFVAGVGQVYCDNNSINKNSGLYVVLKTAYKSKLT